MIGDSNQFGIMIYIKPRNKYEKSKSGIIYIPSEDFIGKEKQDLETILIYAAEWGLDVGDIISILDLRWKFNKSYEIIPTGFLPLNN